jgi:hypothetical protein
MSLQGTGRKLKSWSDANVSWRILTEREYNRNNQNKYNDVQWFQDGLIERMFLNICIFCVQVPPSTARTLFRTHRQVAGGDVDLKDVCIFTIIPEHKYICSNTNVVYSLLYKIPPDFGFLFDRVYLLVSSFTFSCQLGEDIRVM